MPSSTIPETGPELLTLREAAKLCAVSERTLWAWSHDGTAPAALRIGKGTARHSRRALVAWIAAGCPRIDGGHGHD
jgi:predicted DNA-binding transcriptional regulator AlpA